MRGPAIDDLPVHEVVVRSSRHSGRIARVRIVVIHDVDVVHVADVGVVDIYVTQVTAATVVPRVIDFAKTQREPADSKTYAKPKFAATQKSHERRPIHRIVADWSRAPTPTTAKIIPASVVERRKPPRLIIHPRPAPGPNVVPISAAIRSPAHGDAVRIPHVTIFWFFPPRTVIVEVGITNHVARNVTRGN